mmetsp:Transcript_38151/g.38522  ORF Transcript_38151/g.38522 Transcript_38151/m.38522 type:complete len:83 (+) Transcript_38151:902-1150(+)
MLAFELIGNSTFASLRKLKYFKILNIHRIYSSKCFGFQVSFFSCSCQFQLHMPIVIIRQLFAILSSRNQRRTKDGLQISCQK